MILNNISKMWLDSYINRPKAALIIESNGDNPTAIEIFNKIHSELSSGVNSPVQIHDFEDQLSIGIDDVRELQKSLSLRANSDPEISRVVVLNYADRLTNQAQNSLLKLIEELPDRTIVVLVVDSRTSMLATIQSRCFIIPILPISESQAFEYSKTIGISEVDAKRAYILSEGNFSKFSKLLSDDSTELNMQITSAKDFLQKSVFDRQKSISKLKDRVEIDLFLEALALTSKSGMRLAGTLEAKNKWKLILKSVLQTQEQISSNVNTKLALLRLSVSIP